MKGSTLSIVALGLLVAGCGASAPDSETDDATATRYVDAASFWTTPAEQAAWQQMIDRVTNEFYDECGDTFCSGDYSNLTSLAFTCAVSSKVGQVHECIWTFGGSSELVDPKTGALTISKPSFQCKFTMNGRASKMVETLNAAGTDRAIERALPGTTATIRDSLFDCFQNPIGATPLSPTFTKTPSYSTVLDSPNVDVDGWIAAERTIEQSFADACPGSFCTDGYANLTGLRLVCAVSDTTTNVKSCAFVIAGSAESVSATKGTVAVDAKSWRCSVPVKGKPNDISAAINAAGTTPVLDRAMPGTTKTLRTMITSCL